MSASLPAGRAAVLKAIDMLFVSTGLRYTLARNTRYFRAKMKESGFKITPGDHPIVPIMLGDAKLATLMADHLLAEGIYVIGFSYPVVPQGKARIRVQISAALTTEELDRAISAFIKVGRELSVI
jgi:glycine C-acetyltransferase